MKRFSRDEVLAAARAPQKPSAAGSEPHIVSAGVVVAEQRQHGQPRPKLTRAGYTIIAGSPTSTQVRLHGETRWRRVYTLCFSNLLTYFVRKAGVTIVLPGFRELP